MYRRPMLLTALALASASLRAQSLSDMTSPGVDDPSKEWCFLAKSTTVIGVPYQPDVTQVTYDGALFTGQAELCFLYGPMHKPMSARQKTFLDGWIPVVEYSWAEGQIRYDYEAFAQTLPNEGAANSVNFVRVRMTNLGHQPAMALLKAAVRHHLDNSRFSPAPFESGSQYEFRPFHSRLEAGVGRGNASSRYADGVRKRTLYEDRNLGIKDGKLLAWFAPGGKQIAAFKVSDPQSIALSAEYSIRLDPGRSRELVFKMPRVPVAATETGFLAKLEMANYESMRTQTILFWKRAVIGKTEFRIPEARVQNAQRTSLVHMMLATRERGGRRFQTDGLPYPDLFLTSNVQAEMAYDFLGRDKDYLGSLDEILRRQSLQGIFMDTSLPQNSEPLIAAQGQTLHALSYHYLLTHDEAYGAKVFPAIVRGIGWMKSAQRKDRYGLMPPSWPYDNEMILGRYTSHNLWCLLGLRSAIRMARDIGETSLANDWVKFESEYSNSIVKALHASALPDGSVPPGLYEYKTGDQARTGFKEYQTDQDWENMLLAAPTEVLPPDDPLLTATLTRLHKTKFREGVMTYRDGQHLHQYITTNVMEQEMANDDQKQALTDLYHVLLHCGPTHEGFENLVEPWTRQINPDCPPPHAWAAMKTALVIRNALIVERGGKAGLSEPDRELHLFSLLSPAWVKPGLEVGFRNAPCEMGTVSASFKFKTGGADLWIDAHWRRKPKAVVVHIPYFLKVDEGSGDGGVTLRNRAVILSPSTRHLELHWSLNPLSDRNTLQDLLLAYRREPGFHIQNGEGVVTPGREGVLTPSEATLPPTPLSFSAVVKAYGIEYRKRFKEFEERVVK